MQVNITNYTVNALLVMFVKAFVIERKTLCQAGYNYIVLYLVQFLDD